jgi:DNA-binding MarR family transcriptional regulator
MDHTTAGEALDLERLFLHTLRRASRAVFSQALRRGASAHLTPQQLFVLGHLVKHPAQPSELARDHHVGMSAMTGLVDGLVGRGLVERCDDPRDRRAVRLHITPAGREAWEQVEARVVDAARQLLAPLSPAQRERLAAALRDLAALTAPGEGEEHGERPERLLGGAQPSQN